MSVSCLPDDTIWLVQKATVAEISAVTGGTRLLAALTAAELSTAEAVHGPDARVDLDILWIFIGEACHLSLASYSVHNTMCGMDMHGPGWS